MSGAQQLASRACLSAGAGLVTAAVPKSLWAIFVKKALAEVMCLELPETPRGTVARGAYSKLMSFIRERRIQCVVIGPGLSHERPTAALVRDLVKNITVPVVLDADGLNAFKGKSSRLKDHGAGLILTPHPREFERLFSMRTPEGKKEKIFLLKKLSKTLDVTLVLKGHRTLVVHKNGSYENRTGNPGMAKGGAGDVLTGVIAAFIAQGLDPFKAACWGVYFHGKAGDLALKSKGPLALLAGDIIEYLPRAFKK